MWFIHLSNRKITINKTNMNNKPLIRTWVIIKFALLFTAVICVEHIYIEAGKPSFHELETFYICIGILIRSKPVKWYHEWVNCRLDR